jgi:hypothetical protein
MYRDWLHQSYPETIPMHWDVPYSVKDIMGLVVYEAKDSDGRKGVRGGQIKAIEVPWDPELEEKYQERLRAMEAMLSLHAIDESFDPKLYSPLPLERKGKKMVKSWRCRFCSVGEERGECYP